MKLFFWKGNITPMHRIFIVEDDATIARLLCVHLQKWGYAAACAQDFSHVAAEARQFDPHLILLDITLPFFNGFYWCGEIRKFSKAPVVFLSSASENMNIILAMQMGADDFIAKPFDLDVLTAKIQALLRRAYTFSGSMQVVDCGGLSLNLREATLSHADAQLPLSKNEFRLAQLLLEHPGEVLSRERIMQALWESDAFVDDNTLSVNITRLRKKLEQLGLPDVIRTRKGLGYQLCL